MLSYTGTTTGYLATENERFAIKNNAYFGVDISSGTARGYDQDDGRVALAAQPTFGVSNPDLLEEGTDAILLSHDINGKVRGVETPDIGPTDHSSAVDASPVPQPEVAAFLAASASVESDALDIGCSPWFWELAACRYGI